MNLRKFLKMTLIIIVGSGLLAGVLITFFYLWAKSGNYPPENYAEIIDYSGESQPQSQNEFTVITYNIGYLSGMTNNLPVKREETLFTDNQERAIASLSSFNPDFIGLQELDINSRRSYHINQMEVLAKALDFSQGAIAINWDKNYVPFPPLPISTHFGKILSGQAVLSKYPIQKNDRIVLEKVASNLFIYNALYLDRVAQVTQIDIQGRTLILINVHLEAFDQQTRLKQTEFVLGLFASYASEYPVLLVGDFNSPLPPDTTEPTINLLLEEPGMRSAVPVERLKDATVFTFPTDNPQTKLDYIFYNPDRIEMIEWQVIKELVASDHLPLMMKFRFR